MNSFKKSELLTIGFMMFSIFFGAGNLIFPPALGQAAGTSTPLAMLGFLTTGVGLPLLGITAIALQGGRYLELINSRMYPWFATALLVVLYLCIGPVFAVPRTGAVSFEIGIRPFLQEDSLKIGQAVYTALFFGASYYLSLNPNKLIDRVGKMLTPVLLVVLAVLFAKAFLSPLGTILPPTGNYIDAPFTQGFQDGYQTMDLLAGLYFGIVISANISSMGVEDEHDNRAETGIGGSFTGIMLAIIYATLGFVGAVSGSYQAIDGATDTGATVLTNLTDRLFGHVGTMFVGLIFIVACFNVCSGLLSTCSSYFHKQFGTVLGYRGWTIVFTLIALVIANIGLSAIIKLSVPVLEALYPIAIVLVLLSLLHGVFTRHFPAVYFWTVLFTAIDSVANGIANLVAAFGGRLVWLETACNWLPLNSVALGWVVPALAGFVVGIIVSIAERMHTH